MRTSHHSVLSRISLNVYNTGFNINTSSPLSECQVAPTINTLQRYKNAAPSTLSVALSERSWQPTPSLATRKFPSPMVHSSGAASHNLRQCTSQSFLWLLLAVWLDHDGLEALSIFYAMLRLHSFNCSYLHFVFITNRCYALLFRNAFILWLQCYVKCLLYVLCYCYVIYL